jgi:hypothetical protein
MLQNAKTATLRPRHHASRITLTIVNYLICNGYTSPHQNGVRTRPPRIKKTSRFVKIVPNALWRGHQVSGMRPWENAIKKPSPAA